MKILVRVDAGKDAGNNDSHITESPLARPLLPLRSVPKYQHPDPVLYIRPFYGPLSRVNGYMQHINYLPCSNSVAEACQ